MKLYLSAFLIFILLFFVSCSRKASSQGDAGSAVEPVINLGPDKFLKSVRKDIEKHDWQSFLAKCDSTQKAVQFYYRKIKEPQYIANILGITEKGNSIADAGKEVTYEDLNKIQSASLSEWQEFINHIEVFGKLTLADKRELKVKLEIIIINNKYYLTGGVN